MLKSIASQKVAKWIRWVTGAMLLVTGSSAYGKELTRLQVSDRSAHLVHEDGSAFIYLAENAWAVPHSMPLPALRKFATARAALGFTVIHVAIGDPGKPITALNYRKSTPFADGDPGKPIGRRGPNNDYWDQLEHVIETFARQGLRTGIAPAWGHESAFTLENAPVFGRFLGDRYKKHAAKIVWILGDGTVDDTTERRNVWRGLASGIEEGIGGADRALMTSIMRRGMSSGEVFHVDPWQDFHSMYRTAESPLAWRQVAGAMDRPRAKPFLELLCAEESKVSKDYHERRNAYWSVFGGALGYTLSTDHSTGGDGISMGSERKDRAVQLGYLRNLFSHRPLAKSSAAPEILFDNKRRDAAFAAALKGEDYAMVYLPQGRIVEVSLSRLGMRKPRAWWFDPRSGKSQKASAAFAVDTYQRFDPPGEPGRGNDWVLVLDGKTFPKP